MQITSVGYILLQRDGVTISQHREVKEAVERASQSPGYYTIKFPDWGVSVPFSSVGSQRSIYLSLQARLQATMSGLRRIIVPSSTVSTNDNPDGYATTGTIFYQRAYETEVASEVLNSALSTEQWGAAYGRGGSGGWRIWPSIASGEDNIGWQTGTTTAPVDAYRRIFISFTLNMSTAAANTMRNNGGSEMKFLDIRQYLANGTGLDGVQGNTRWVTWLGRFLGYNGQVRFGISAGGAGTPTTNYAANIDLTPFISSEFPWFCIMYDEQNVLAKVWVKRSGSSGVTKIIEKDSSPGTGEHLQSNGRGWGVGERAICGYLNQQKGYATDGSAYFTIDDLTVTNYWVGPVY